MKLSPIDAYLISRNSKTMREATPLYDQINQNWVAIEDFFRGAGILSPVSILCGEGFYLGIQKSGGKWRICLAEDVTRPPEKNDWVPVSDCKVELRTSLFPLMPLLFKAVVEQNEITVINLRKAVDESSRAVEQLLGVKSEP